jgi:condensin complex subunit 3
VRDAVAFGAINRFDTRLSATYEAQLESFDEGEYRTLEALNELFEFLDEILGPEDADELVEPVVRRGRKRRSGSVSTQSSEDGEAEHATPRPTKKDKGRK